MDATCRICGSPSAPLPSKLDAIDVCAWCACVSLVDEEAGTWRALTVDDVAPLIDTLNLDPRVAHHPERLIGEVRRRVEHAGMT